MQDLLSPFIFDETEIVPNVSITIDPLLIEHIPREARTLPIIRAMQTKKFASKGEAQTFLMHLTYKMAGPRNTGLKCTPFEKSKMLIAEAFATRHRSKKLSKAKEALALSSSCAEAYLVFADAETDMEKKIDFLNKGLNVANTLLDSTRLSEPDGYFWQELITRPYMRCRTALAQALWNSGKRDIAISHMKELLRLNPYDNQGLRYHLVNMLLENDSSSPDVDEYCGTYETDRCALVKYACALWKFARFGKSQQSSDCLQKAVDLNEFVPAVLCGQAKVPMLQNTRVEKGSVQEAIAYLSLGGGAWHNVSGALDWLAESHPQEVSSKTILQTIAMAKDFKRAGNWVEQVPIEILRITS